MTVSLTAMYAAILALMMTAFAINVTVHRGKLGIDLGDGGNPQMLRMMRLHGNASENIPIALLLMLTYELNGGSHTALHVFGLVLVVARLLHAGGLWQSASANFGRVSGQGATWLTIAVLAIANIVKIL